MTSTSTKTKKAMKYGISVMDVLVYTHLLHVHPSVSVHDFKLITVRLP